MAEREALSTSISWANDDLHGLSLVCWTIHLPQVGAMNTRRDTDNKDVKFKRIYSTAKQRRNCRENQEEGATMRAKMGCGQTKFALVFVFIPIQSLSIR